MQITRRAERSPDTVQASWSRRRQLVLVLGSLSAFGALTIDLYLPAMPRMATHLDASTASVQATLTVFVVGLAVGQVLVGPLSDAWGRRRPLLIGLALYAVASLACALAPDVGWLIAARVLQSLGAAAGTVLARAIARDLFSGVAMTRFLSTLMLVNGLAPILAPVVGGQLLAVTTWRALFVLLAGIGVLLLSAVALTLPETVPPERRQSAHPRALARTFARLAADRRFVRLILAAGLMFAAVFTYISGSSFVLQDGYGLSPQQFSLVFAVNGLGIVACSQLNGWLVGRVGTEAGLLTIALATAVLGSAGVLGCALAGAPLPLLLVFLFLVVAMLGPVLTNATSMALAEHGTTAGAASSLQGMTQFLIAGVAAAALGATGDDAVAMGAVMCCCAVPALLLALVRPSVRRH
ncbi:multidrug effflux MFS transporter [Modestobacter marinus]|uniref:DHA1 family bicyclomycin/chloramphenicol resistance-like MFS transporter n=1 Tax=Modestobacter marinus TaxID=477641 RepID=A0A846LTX5_9ACTN|nr:multidrug effflux MFS transporter [Modestobacter marinus]NIH69864.1 DHA1 family bicyclomycin/chloramphenicol resistance-like MFS transporter [Modestobacter marinus]